MPAPVLRGLDSDCDAAPQRAHRARAALSRSHPGRELFPSPRPPAAARAPGSEPWPPASLSLARPARPGGGSVSAESRVSIQVSRRTGVTVL